MICTWKQLAQSVKANGDMYSAYLDSITRVLRDFHMHSCCNLCGSTQSLDYYCANGHLVVTCPSCLNRLEQELIYYIEKLDVNEEKQRLANHLNYFVATLENGHGQGKKLGFIAQEMGREINTLGSKSNHAMMQNIVVQMKDELEQIKEQVLNVM